MERVAKLLSKSRLAGTLGDCVSADQIAMGAWPAAVGKKIAARTRPVAVVRGKLIVEVEDYVWQSQLWPLRHQILANLRKLLDASTVTDLELRLAVPRRGPQLEAVPVRAADDADSIADPVLGHIYRNHRKRFAT